MIPSLTRIYTSQVVHDFFHQQNVATCALHPKGIRDRLMGKKTAAAIATGFSSCSDDVKTFQIDMGISRLGMDQRTWTCVVQFLHDIKRLSWT